MDWNHSSQSCKDNRLCGLRSKRQVNGSETVTLPDHFNLPFRSEGVPATLLPSASFSLKHTVSAPTRKPLRIFRYVLSVSMNYFIPEAPATRLAVASKAALIFSLTIRLASRRALLPPRISFIIRSATTPFASAANNIKELNIRWGLRL